MARLRGVSAQPDLLDAERGSRADDRTNIEWLADAVEQQGDAGLRAPPPASVQALDLGHAELPGHRRTCSTRYPALAAMRLASQPVSVSQRCSESAPRLRCTTRYAEAPSASRASQRVSMSCSAFLPILIGGLDQMRSTRPGRSASSGSRQRTFARLAAAAFLAQRSRARRFTSTAQTRARGDLAASTSASGP